MRHLALKNLKGRKVYSVIIIIAAAAAAAMTLVTLFLVGGVRRELEENRRRLGPDLAVVPAGCKERGHIYLSKGPPTHGGLPPETLEQLGDFQELEAVAPQKILGHASFENLQATLIGFNPAEDFTVRPWLDHRSQEKFPGQDSGLILGALVPAQGLPDSLSATRAGRLLPTGTYLDTSVFIPRPAAEIEAEPTWILLRLHQGVSPDIAANRLEVNIPRIEILRRPEMFKTINDQLYGLLEGGGFGLAAFLTIIGAFLVTGAVFALMTHERQRELGLMKAMGAGNAFVFKLIMGEATLLGAAGAVLGAGLVSAGLWGAQAGLFSVEIPFNLSSSPVAPHSWLAAMALEVAVTTLAALYPALAAVRMEPYAAIRGGE